MYSDPQDLQADHLRKSRRLQRLPPEYGLQDLPRMSTTTATQTQETYGTGQPPASLVLHTPQWPRPFHGEPFEDVEDWLDDFDRVAEVNDWDERKKLRRVYFALEDSARTWFANHEPSITTWQEFQRQIRDTYSSPARKERAEQALQSRVQKPNESVAMFVEDMSRLFKRADPGMTEAKKVRLLMRAVKEQLFAGLMRRPPATVAEFVSEATTMERALQQRSSVYDRQITLGSASPSLSLPCDTDALRELVRSVVREELDRLQGVRFQPTATSLTDIVREEVRQAAQPFVQTRPEAAPVLTYAQAVRLPAQPVNHHNLPSSEEPLRHFQGQTSHTTMYESTSPRINTRKSDVWRTPDYQPLCFHCGEAGHLYRACYYRRIGLQGYHPGARRPREGERPREIQQYLASRDSSPYAQFPPFEQSLPTSRSPSPQRRQSRSPPPRRSASPSRYTTFSASVGNRPTSPSRGN